jgi:hypothetical protein
LIILRIRFFSQIFHLGRNEIANRRGTPEFLANFPPIPENILGVFRFWQRVFVVSMAFTDTQQNEKGSKRSSFHPETKPISIQSCLMIPKTNPLIHQPGNVEIRGVEFNQEVDALGKRIRGWIHLKGSFGTGLVHRYSSYDSNFLQRYLNKACGFFSSSSNFNSM